MACVQEASTKIPGQSQTALIALLGLALIVSACSDSDEQGFTGVYKYQAFALSGDPSDSGILIIQQTDSQLVAQLDVGEEVIVLDGWLYDQSRIELWERTQRLGVRGLTGIKADRTIRGVLLLNTGGPPLPHRTGTFRANRIGS